MSRTVVSRDAAEDIADILNWTVDHFGEAAMLRYLALIRQAMFDLGEDPMRHGSSERADISPVARTYHLAHSRKNVDPALGRVKNPRHFILFRWRGDNVVEIGRILHERADLDRHLPAEYRGE